MAFDFYFLYFVLILVCVTDTFAMDPPLEVEADMTRRQPRLTCHDFYWEHPAWPLLSFFFFLVFGSTWRSQQGYFVFILMAGCCVGRYVVLHSQYDTLHHVGSRWNDSSSCGHLRVFTRFLPLFEVRRLLKCIERLFHRDEENDQGAEKTRFVLTYSSTE